MSAIADVLGFLLEHLGLIEAIKNAIGCGCSKEALLKAIKEAEIAASDALMQAELGNAPTVPPPAPSFDPATALQEAAK
jgi:hypothetical protein